MVPIGIEIEASAFLLVQTTLGVVPNIVPNVVETEHEFEPALILHEFAPDSTKTPLLLAIQSKFSVIVAGTCQVV